MSTQTPQNSSHCVAKATTGLILAIIAWPLFVFTVWVLQSPVFAVVVGIVFVHAVVIFLKYGYRVDKNRKMK